MTKRLRKSILKVAVALLLLGVLNGCVNRMFYYPTDRVYRNPADFDLAYEDVEFKSGDGTPLHGWFLPAKGEARGTVVHFHGNAGNLTGHFGFVRWLPGRNFNVFIFDYRGYGLSAGRITRQGLVHDGIAALQVVAQREDVDPEKIFVLGQSLGGAVALAAVTDGEAPRVAAVAIDSAFYSYTSIVRDKLGEMPLVSLLKWPLSYLLITDSKSPSRSVAEVSPTPLLLLHGTADRVIPYHHGQWLYEKARDPKRLVTIEDSRHTGSLVQQDPVYRDLLVEFFSDTL